ncbi:MAG TPA: DsbA family protein [Dehalococcoidia bacterium]|nr:DsbA family protein [Dehalococcoidia bacterium]
MVEETQGPGGEETAPEVEAPRPAARRPRATQPARPPDSPRGSGQQPYLLTMAASAIVLVFALAFFMAGFFTHAAVDDDGGGTTVAGNPTTTTGQTPVVLATPTPPAVVEASVDDDPAWGPEDAPVTIIEFSDFQCPFCSRFFTETYPQIRQEYEGQVRFVYRDFPLTSLHENAQKAGEAGECADEQGKFWDYHDTLFNNASALDDASLKGYASQLGLDSGTFDQCLDSGKYTEEVQKDYQEGISYGVTGTPAFFINGVTLIGAQPYANFKAAIDAALQEAGG